MDKQSLGQQAEHLAHLFLQRQGLRLIDRNFRCALGEIDLIMLQKDELVFVEVRYRRSAHFGGGAESVTSTKQQKLIRTAQYYLQTRPSYAQKVCRFDVVAVQNLQTQPLWIKDAFQVDY